MPGADWRLAGVTEVQARFREFSTLVHQSRFARGIGAIAGGAFVRNAIVLAVAPILTRLYSPADFGVLTVFGSLVGIGLAISSLSYQLAIPIPARDSHGVLLVQASIAIAACFAVITFAASLALREPATSWLALQGSPNVLLLLGPTLFGAAVYQSLNYWASRRRQFRQIGHTRLQQGIAQDVTQVALGLAGSGSFGLVIGYAIGQAFGVSRLYKVYRLHSRVAAGLSLRRLLAVCHKYRSFPLFSTWAALVNVVGIQLPAILVSHLFGAQSAGQFGLAVRVLALPAVLIGQACAQVFYPAAAELDNRHGHTDRLTSGMASLLFVVGSCMFLPIVAQGSILFRVAFGAAWQQAGDFSRILALWSLVSLVSSPISTIAVVRNRQRAALGITLYETTLRFAAIWVGYHFGSVRLAVMLYACAGICISVVYIWWVFRLVQVSWADWLSETKGFILGAVLVSVLSLWIGSNGYESLAAFVSVFGVVACLWFAPLRKWVAQLG